MNDSAGRPGPAPDGGPPAAIPAGLRTAAIALVAEAGLILVVAVLVLGVLQAAHFTSGAGVATVAVLVGCGAGLVALARALFRARRWARGPVVAVQLLMLPIAWTFRNGPAWWATLVLGGLAVVALVGLLLPSTTRALSRPD